MEIKVACDTKLYVALENLKEFQGNLKNHGNKEKLKKQILEQGFSAPMFVWKNDGKYYLLDGHGRLGACKDLKQAGYKIPDLPCVEIFAKTKTEAKKKLLSYVSQFGKVEGEGLYKFILDAELQVEDLEDFEIPEIDLDEFKAEFFDENTVDKVNRGDENSEWVGMPEFEEGDSYIKLTFQFQTEEDRDSYCATHGIKPDRKMNKQWIVQM